MPHHKILIPAPEWATPQTSEAADELKASGKLWVPQGLMVQWGPYGEQDGAPAVGIGSGHMQESDEDIARIERGEGKLQDMYMLWFTRSQINETIRTLRRARNAAYGTDE